MNATPWYRQFWPWFVIAPLIATVIGGFATLIIAGSPPAMVVDDVGQIEKTVAEDQARDRRAAALGIRAELRFDATGVSVDLAGAAPAALRLTLIHPTRADADRSAVLVPADGAYRGRIDRPRSRAYVLLTDAENDWRLAGVIALDEKALTLRPRVGG